MIGNTFRFNALDRIAARAATLWLALFAKVKPIRTPTANWKTMANDPFVLNIANFVAKAKGNMDLVVRKISLDMFSRVVEKSPIDTGRFKSNWQVSINATPPDGVLNAEKDKKGNVNFEPAVAAVMAAALETKAGDVIYLVNNVSYANRLEYGWSQQAPAGMVRLSIMEWNKVVRDAASDLP